MSCNITGGIAKGCNDQVGGISGIHYLRWYDDLVFEKDANGVVVRVYRESVPQFNLRWLWVEADNGMGNLTETYNVGGTGNILGFNQSLKFFIPTTATPSVNNPTQSLENWVKVQAAQNNMLIGVEIDHNQPMRDYSSKAFLMGQDRPAFTNSGNKQTGIVYGDNNGYNIEWMADSKEPMNELAYMAMHSYNLVCDKYINPATPTDYSFDQGNIFNLETLRYFEGGNIRELFPDSGYFPEIYVMPGELLTIEATISMDWGPNAFSGTTFLPEWEMIGDGSHPLTYITDIYPLPTAPGVAIVQVKGTYENTTSDVRGIIPIRLAAPGPNVDISGGGIVPSAKFLTITRTT